MNHTSLIVPVLLSLLLLGATCTQPTDISNNLNINGDAVQNSNTNNGNENINSTGLTSEASNANAETTTTPIDTSEWLTYTNEKYGFSFKYPSDWEDIKVKNYDTDEYRTGHKTFISFSNDKIPTATFSIESLNYQFIGPTDGGDIEFKNINFNLSNSELAEKISRIPESSIEVSRLTLLDRKALKVNETYLRIDVEYANTYFLIPDYHGYNLRIVGNSIIDKNVEALADTLQQL